MRARARDPDSRAGTRAAAQRAPRHTASAAPRPPARGLARPAPREGGASREGRPDGNALAHELRDARADAALVVLEGFHPLKHALRFGADVTRVVTFDRAALLALAASHAPELRARIGDAAIEIPRKDFKRLGPYEPHTGVVSVAARARHDPLAVLTAPAVAPVVLLDEPRHRGNLGAVVRVAAAAEAAGVLTTGEQDPWHPVAVRGSAGLHFALPVAWLPAGLPGAGAPGGSGGPGAPPAAGGPPGGRPLVVLDPTGKPFDPRALPARPLLVFGSERQGVAEELRARADECLALPMRDGVSSLNLATSVAAVLYSLRLAAGR